MQRTKTPKADLQSKRGLFLEIGLAVALLFVIGAFFYSPGKREVEKIDLNYGPVEEEITEITRQDQKPPEPPKRVEVNVVSDVLKIVTNDTKIDTSMDFQDFDEDVEIKTAAVKEVEEDEVQIFVRAEQMPKFRGGGLEEFRKWVFSELQYPAIAQENQISGNVVVQFVIEKDGSLTNIKVLQSPDKSLSDEAVRVLKKSDKWTPGRQRDKPVRCSYTLPVVFRLN